MEDGLVLNLAGDDTPASSRSTLGSKGGRWTDRFKAKRVKRTTELLANLPVSLESGERSPKRRRVEKSSVSGSKEVRSYTQPRLQTQIISSLFSYNPKVEIPVSKSALKTALPPSNAPLTDSSTFLGLGLHPLLSSHLASKMSITKPTSIQRAALPATLSTTPEMMECDIFIQSQTGSGKTLSFLLPIIQDLLPLSSLSYIDRSIGTLAIIISPTRELAKQISDVLENLLKLRLRAENEDADDPNATRLTRWLVSGLLIGGATRTHEKARLRKGLPILVSTPGRLLDHLQNTSSFNVAKCRWLVLDEADRLMELGFEETITGILKGLEGHRKLALQAVNGGIGKEVGGWDWGRRRRTILCSATIREDVQKLAGATLINPLMIRASEPDSTPSTSPPPKQTSSSVSQSENEKFSPPSQLSQNYVVVPLKQRLVVLVALLRKLITQSQNQPGAKAIVFLSCTDAVDFVWKLFGGSRISDDESMDSGRGSDDSDTEENDEQGEDDGKTEPVFVKSSFLPHTSIFRLHGSLPTPTRLASLRGFSGNSKNAAQFSVLLCTSVASRGLDLPLVRSVVQYDLPTEAGATEYLHRIGRTARAGHGGEAWSMVAPSEVEWVQWVEGKMRGNSAADQERSIALVSTTPETILKTGFGGKGHEFEERATQVQLSFERWVIRHKENSALARKAYLSHLRAYATHPSNEKHMFHIRHLHLGHLAKAFALREAPKAVTGAAGKVRSQGDANTRSAHKSTKAVMDVDQSRDAERRMREIVRSQGRQSKRGGVMMSSGASEFQIAGGYNLEKLVR